MNIDLNRRSVAKGIAWSVPVLVAGAPAPAIAGSCTPTTVEASAQLIGSFSEGDFAATYAMASDPTGSATVATALPSGTTWKITETENVQAVETSPSSPPNPDNAPATIDHADMASISISPVTVTENAGDDDNPTTWTIKQVITVKTLRDIQPGETFRITLSRFSFEGYQLNSTSARGSRVGPSYATSTSDDGCTTTHTLVNVTAWNGSSSGG